MKKIFITSIILILLSVKPASAQLLEVDFGNPPVAPLAPVFTVENFLPGDEEEREITVRNTSDSPIPLILYSDKTEEEIPNWPSTPDGNEFSLVLELEIYDDTTLIYSNSLDGFFADSENGMSLGNLNAGEEKTFRVKVKFPSSAGNEYQLAKVVFDLMFEQYREGEKIVINEVHYNPDSDHGSDKFEGVDAAIEGNGAGSINIIDIKISNTCIVLQQNIADIETDVNLDSNTGDNTGGNIITGTATSIVNIITNLNFNIGSCGTISNRNDEWVELLNTGNETVNLEGWSLIDDSGTETELGDVDVNPGDFVLIAKSNTTWDFWNEDSSAIKISLGSDIGNGLGDSGDHLYLVKPDNSAEDAVGWGDDTQVWNMNQPNAGEGNSISRIPNGMDTDAADDWDEIDPPTPGY